MRNKLVRDAIKNFEFYNERVNIVKPETVTIDNPIDFRNDIYTVLEYIEDLERKLAISDAYNEHMCVVLTDYDGEYDPETKTGSLEGLAELIDYTMELLLKQIAKDDTSPIYFNMLGDYNILNEEVTKDEK